MTCNLKTFPDVHQWFYRKKVDDWKKGFEKRQRWFLVPANMGAWIRENSDAKSLGELLQRYIQKEVLGE